MKKQTGNEVGKTVSDACDTQPATPNAAQVTKDVYVTQSQPVDTRVAAVSASKAASDSNANFKPVKFFC
jgi:hypothetical protein